MTTNPQNKKPTIQKNPNGGNHKPTNKSSPWGRAASQYRPGIFAKRYLLEHDEACASEVFTALREALRQMNQERIEIGENPIRGCTYNSFAKYWHWFKLRGLVERTLKTAPAIYVFLERKRFYRITKKGRNEVRAWGDPVRRKPPKLPKTMNALSTNTKP
jgi:hypothetical protein